MPKATGTHRAHSTRCMHSRSRILSRELRLPHGCRRCRGTARPPPPASASTCDTERLPRACLRLGAHVRVEIPQLVQRRAHACHALTHAPPPRPLALVVLPPRLTAPRQTALIIIARVVVVATTAAVTASITTSTATCVGPARVRSPRLTLQPHCCRGGRMELTLHCHCLHAADARIRSGAWGPQSLPQTECSDTERSEGRTSRCASAEPTLHRVQTIRERLSGELARRPEALRAIGRRPATGRGRSTMLG
mmetsp:Transcript_4024/g.12896  ORF Transcript_4024/g.12896 Transcript_4024/m.12896 type:complete len:251 (-) Transcript_4024:1156-1908(-)